MMTFVPIYSQNLFRTIIENHVTVRCKLTIRSLNNTKNALDDVNEFDLIITESTTVSSTQPTFLIDKEIKEDQLYRLKTLIEQLMEDAPHAK